MKKSLKLCGLAISLGLGAVAGSAAFAAPVNTAFKDDALYQCIVGAYNTENTATLANTANLTNEQLATIKTLDCRPSLDPTTVISDLTGIDKLVNLATTNFNGNNISVADFSKNTKLYTLDISENPLKTLKVPAGIRHIEAYDLSGLPLDFVSDGLLKNLGYFGATNSALKAIPDFTGATDLTKLEMKGTGAEKLNLTKNLKLNDVSVDEDTILSLATPFGKTTGATALPTVDLTKVIHNASANTGFIDEDNIADNDIYTYDKTKHLVTIIKPESAKEYIVVDGYRISVTPVSAPADTTTNEGDDEDELNVPATSTGEVVEEEKKENPDTSEASKLILGLSILGAAMLGIAVKAIVSARAKRA